MSGGYSMVGTALDESDDELPGSISLAQRLAPSLAEFERGRDSVTGSRRLEGAFRGGWDRQRVDTSEWKPTTFFSSRDARAKSGGESMRLEDIMDEEDLVGVGNRQRGLNKFSNLDAEVVALRGRSSTRGYELLRAMGWKLGDKFGSNYAELEEEDVLPSDDVQLPSEGLGRFYEDARKRKTDRAGLGSNAVSLGDSGIRLERSGPVRQREFAEEDDDIYNRSDTEEYDAEEGGPVIVRDVTVSSSVHGQDPLVSSSSLPKHTSIPGFVDAGRVYLSKDARQARQSKSDREDDTKVVPHNFETDRYRKKMDLPFILQEEAAKVKNAEQRRLLLGEKLLPRKVMKDVKQEDGGSQTVEQSEEAKKRLLESYGENMSSRFISAGVSNVAVLEKDTKPEISEPVELQLNKSDRQEQFFQPTVLLCKRFNVPHTEVNLAKIVSTQGMKGSRFLSAGTEFDRRSTGIEEKPDQAPDAVDEDVDNVFDAPLKQEERPSVALFKAIFDDDSDG